MMAATIPTSFHWTEGGSEVLLVGSFSQWRERIPMTRESRSNDGATSPRDVFSVTVDLVPGIHSYKFIVDGVWRYATNQPTLPDQRGNINNCCSISRSRDSDELTSNWSKSQSAASKGYKQKLLHAQLLLPGVQEVPTAIRRAAAAAAPSPSRKPLPTASSVGGSDDANQSSPETVSPTSLQANIHATRYTPAATTTATSAITTTTKPDQTTRSSSPSSNDAGSSSDDSKPRLSRHLRVMSLQNFSAAPTPSSTKFASSAHRLLLVMVGLPARGKSFIARKLCRYLNWLGYFCKVFNLGSYRRQNLGAYHSQDFFRSDNVDGMKQRTEIAMEALSDMIQWFKSSSGHVAIFDGTNSTHSRRQLILDRLKQERPDLRVKTIFIEVICNDVAIIETNIRDTKLSCPDYAGIDPEVAVKDFRERIENYKIGYETMGLKDNLRYIKIFDVGRQIVANRINGFVPSRIVFYLNNLHIIPRPIYLTRHGQSVYNLTDKLGGDSPLTEKGLEFAELLKEFIIHQDFDAETELCVWSSTMRRAVQTAEIIPCAQYVRWKTMEEINVGICDGMSYEEVAEKMPEEFAARAKDKLRYRYPRGESYEDLIRRLDPVIIELERQRKPIVIVAHRAVLRCLYAYFADENDRDQVPHVSIPLHTVIRLKPHAYGTAVERFKLMDGKD